MKSSSQPYNVRAVQFLYLQLTWKVHPNIVWVDADMGTFSQWKQWIIMNYAMSITMDTGYGCNSHCQNLIME